MKHVVLLSGGLDSSVLLAYVKHNNFNDTDSFYALNMFYGQRHQREIESAKKIAKYYGATYVQKDLSSVFINNTTSTMLANCKEDVPQGDYKSQGEVPSTYVPFRNGLFLACAASMFYDETEVTTLYAGMHSDDARSAYPDCTSDFVYFMDQVIREGTNNQVGLSAPFIGNTKANIVREGMELNVPFELTWSCYEGGDKPCGKCATCIDRMKAFAQNNAVDPLVTGYANWCNQ